MSSQHVQAHLGHESTGTTADLYVVEVPEEVRRTQARYAAEIEGLARVYQRRSENMVRSHYWRGYKGVRGV